MLATRLLNSYSLCIHRIEPNALKGQIPPGKICIHRQRRGIVKEGRRRQRQSLEERSQAPLEKRGARRIEAAEKRIEELAEKTRQKIRQKFFQEQGGGEKAACAETGAGAPAEDRRRTDPRQQGARLYSRQHERDEG